MELWKFMESNIQESEVILIGDFNGRIGKCQFFTEELIESDWS